METTGINLSKSPKADVVLSYAVQQKRWEHGILWLIAIVCISQLLTLPSSACEWAIVAGNWSWATGGMPLRYREEFLAILMISRAVTSLFLSLCAFLVLRGFEAWRTRLAISIWILTFLAASSLIVRGTLSLSDTENYFIELRSGNGTYSFAEEIGNLTLWCYPMVLLLGVLEHSNASRRQLGASGIWWLTASAAMLVAAHTLIEWVTNFEEEWNTTIVTFFLR